MKNSKYLSHRRQNSHYEDRLGVFKREVSQSASLNTVSADDLLTPLAQNEESRSALDSYMDQLDKTFDVSDIDTVQPFLPISSSEKLEDIGLRVVSLSADEVKNILTKGYQFISAEGVDINDPEQLAAFIQEALMELDSDVSEEEMLMFAQEVERIKNAPGETLALRMNAPEIADAQDNQIRIDRSDIVQRVLKARSKDTSITVVQGPKTSQ